MSTSDNKSIIQTKGLKATPTRLAIMDVMEKSTKPLDVSEILLRLQEDQKVYADQATVYRIVDAFYTTGIIKRLQFQDSKVRYERNLEDHHHVVCSQCGRVEDIMDCSVGKLEHEIYKKKGFKVTGHSLEFFGLCKSCQN